MRIRLVFLMLVAFVSPVVAQQSSGAAAPSAATLRTYASSADVAAIVARLKAQPAQPLRSAPLTQIGPYTLNIEYRSAVAAAAAAVHETDAELFYVIDGTATFVTGGKLGSESRTNAANLTGTSIVGGASQKVAKGDMMLVPEGTPHWFSAIDGTVTLLSLHLPRK